MTETIERFTKEEYILLRRAVLFRRAACLDVKENSEFAVELKPLDDMKCKLDKIIKEVN